MGTSKGMVTPTGGLWTDAKHEVTAGLEAVAATGDPLLQQAAAAGAVRSTIRALGGLALGIPRSSSQRAGGTGTGGARARAIATKARAVGQSVSGLAAFGTVVQGQGLDEALRALNLEDLAARSAIEVISLISARLSEASEGVDAELMNAALNETILEAADLGDELGYADLEDGLQAFLLERGPEGLVESLLAKFAYDLVIASVLQHIDLRSDSASQTEAFLSGVEAACRSHARTVIERYRADGSMARTDWFGAAGRRLGREIAQAMATQLGQ